MKKRDLERKLRIAGCYLKREGHSHVLWINPKTGVTEAVPRHTDVKEPLAKKDPEKSECGINDRTFCCTRFWPKKRPEPGEHFVEPSKELRP